MARRKYGAGQSVLVTGASGGIGLDLAECFAQDGYDLILTARTAEALEKAAKDLAERHGIEATAIAADLGVPDAGAKLAEAIAGRGLAVDVLVNNAGYGAAGAFGEADGGVQLGMVDLNIRALVELTQIYWPAMLANRRGGVLNLGSTAAFQPGPLMAVYYASKAFVLSFSEALWKEAQGSGVHVSCLCPGPTESNFHARARTEATRISRLGKAMQSRTVARMGYRAFKRNQRVLVTGARNAAMANLAPLAPRRVVLAMVKYLQGAA